MITTNNTIISKQYNDLYFTKTPVEEAEYVFIKPNKQLLQNQSVTILELGFGFGINFLTTIKNLSTGNKLDYYAFEKHPVKSEELRQVLELPNIQLIPAQIKSLLYSQYRKLPTGRYQFKISENINLHLIIDDIVNITQYNIKQIDIFYLDGFAPKKNPSMWQLEIMQHLYQIANTKASLSTFSASSIVNKNLTAAGFITKKIKGFAGKREMLTATLEKPNRRNEQKRKKVAIIGAGIAGISCSHSLQNRGIDCEIFEAEDRIAKGASEIPLARISPPFAPGSSQYSKNLRAAYIYTLGLLQNYDQNLKLQDTLQLLVTPRLRRLASDLQKAEKCSELFSVQTIERDLLHKQEAITLFKTSYINGYDFCNWLLPAQVELHLNHKVNTIEYNSSYTIKTSLGDYRDFTHVILANAYAAREFGIKNLTPKYGGLSQFAWLGPDLDYAIGHQGNSTFINNSVFTGANYSKEYLMPEVEIEFNRKNILSVLPEAKYLGKLISHWQNMRTTTIDHMPIVGKLRDQIYTSIGHGSRGMISAPYAAELIAEQIRDPY